MMCPADASRCPEILGQEELMGAQRMSRIVLAVSVALVLSISSMRVEGQTATGTTVKSTTGDARPKIGLVLSGGGARGWAHIGVLRWFEEHHVPVDYVAGSSMGGPVGAMYAMGLSPAEIQRVGNSLDWDKLLTGPPSFDELSFRRREDQRAYPSELELGLRNGINLPSGVNSGHNIALVFDELTLPYATLRNFDDLPIPFRCVATDMIEAREVVLKSGSLSKALRTTMSIPGVFTPVETDNHVLADGGLLNMIPTDIVKDMGADIIIAINVGPPLGTREDIETLPGMLNQIVAVGMIQSDRRNLQLADLVITPPLDKYKIFDFTEVDAISALGYEAADQYAAALQKYALSDADWEGHLAARKAKQLVAIPVPVEMEVKGTKEPNARAIAKDLENNIGNPINPSVLGSQLSEIRGEGRYESLDYTLTRANEQDRLEISVRDKAYGPTLLIPIIQYRSSNLSSVDFSLGGRVTVFDVAKYGSELRVDLVLGTDNLIAGEYYWPLGDKGFFVAPRGFFAANSLDLYTDGERIAEYRERRGGVGIDLGYTLNRRAQLRVGYEVGGEHARVAIGEPILPEVSGLTSKSTVQIVYDGHDSAMVPTRGVGVAAGGRWVFDAPGGDQGFPQADFGASGLKRLNDKASVFTYGHAGTTFSKVAAPLEQFTLGGPFRLGAFGPQEFRGDHYFLASAGYLQRIAYLPPVLGHKLYGAGWYELGSAFIDKDSIKCRSSVSAAMIMETRLGPLTIGGALGSGSQGKFIIAMGKVF